MSWNAEWYSYRDVSRSENRSGAWWAEIWARESMFSRETSLPGLQEPLKHEWRRSKRTMRCRRLDSSAS